ncbi:AdeC/AdeK/OprM family multidrug efflux complex outer membrane factor [Entomomonas moraniae]|uniref:AdeC/AdeK/OprM family multidrug efflux complex outer membrane factor n=1 Tax=Entomomonas moraniae TaxID=2213226 RepID=A0A3Q9JP60_9GAMM|nr:AdeC/AdeK/OprM family multidrug efflux complex outer membrane factor [Entomomonas moraniae]AZS52247.1 AdeC/AdeK/OprM family multidrug efflux complex outer membrane factor [Entomomonas moraniae]
MNKSLLSIMIMTVTLTGCTLMPNYQRPDLPVQNTWPTGDAYSSGQQGQYVSLGWRDFFADKDLQSLIETAIANNKDLRVAALNVAAYEAQYRIQRSELFPNLDANGTGSRQHVPADVSSTGRSRVNSSWGVTLGVTSYELDFFGRIRSLNEAALQQYLSTQEAQRNTQISLIASVANAWLTLQADKALLKLTEETLENYQYNYDLVKRSNEVGVASSLDLAQARTTVEGAKVNLATYKRQVAQDINLLALLLGTNLPADLANKKESNFDLQYVKEIPAGLPSDLLANRPDIISAEHQLMAANANIGAARAAFFPSISLTSNVGTMSPSFSNLFSAGQGSWLFQPTINLPIFTAGRLRGNLDYATLQKDINVATYEKTIQTAFKEVADGLASRETYREQVVSQGNFVEANQVYYDLADQRYQAGIDSYMTLLDAQRQLFSSQQSLISVRLAQLTSEVNLYKALGGGWQETTKESPNAKNIPITTPKSIDTKSKIIKRS